MVYSLSSWINVDDTATGRMTEVFFKQIISISQQANQKYVSKLHVVPIKFENAYWQRVFHISNSRLH